MNGPNDLRVLHAEIEERTRRIASKDWPCREGCDHCCRNLAAIPRLTEPEWELALEALRSLPLNERRELSRRIGALEGAVRPIVCPLLDRDRGACRIYTHRPVACRTYGFYIERDRGLYCGIIEEQVDRGERTNVVWGNHARVDARLTGFGESTDLLTWFRRAGPPDVR